MASVSLFSFSCTLAFSLSSIAEEKPTCTKLSSSEDIVVFEMIQSESFKDGYEVQTRSMKCEY